jgi:hypothetical protein
MNEENVSASPNVLSDSSLSAIPHPAITNEDLHQMVTEAARRATALLNGEAIPDPRIDLARIMATAGSRFNAVDVAARAGIHRAELGRIRRAYQISGEIGVDVYLQTFEPDQLQREQLAEAAHAMGRMEPTRTDNRLTVESVGLQVRLGPDGRWYPYTYALGEWSPVAGVSESAADAYRAAKRAKSQRTGRST